MEKQLVKTRGIRVADECWVALALLHQINPERESFAAREILDRVRREKIHGELRAGLPSQIYWHNVANVAPSSARYRMFYKLGDGTYRLFRPGDDAHPARNWKTMPVRAELPERYRELLDWYGQQYCRREPRAPPVDDVQQMPGAGKQMRERQGGGDAFIARERGGWEEESAEDLVNLVQRCEADTRRLLGPPAARRLGGWRRHAESETELVEFIQRLLWGKESQNSQKVDQQNGLSLERIVLDYRPELFTESDRQQARRTLGV